MLSLRAGLALVVLGCSATLAKADDFRVRSEIFIGEETEPFSSNVTIFSGGLVYDLITFPQREVAVFDPPRSRFILLSPGNRVRTELTTTQVSNFLLQMRTALNERKGKAPFLIDPKYDIRTPHAGQVIFDSKWFKYDMEIVGAQNDSIAQQYAEFIDWYTRLNVMIMKNPDRLARMPINDWLKSKKRIPREIKLTLYEERTFGGKKERANLRSKHEQFNGLNQADRDKVQEIQRWLVQFEQVSYSDYQEQTKRAEAAASR